MSVSFRKLIQLRGDKTQKEVAKALGVFAPTVSQWESGERTPTVENLTALSHYYRVNIASMWETQEFPAMQTGEQSQKAISINLANNKIHTLGKLEQRSYELFMALDVDNSIRAVKFMEELLEKQKLLDDENEKWEKENSGGK